jgi:predicted esterase
MSEQDKIVTPKNMLAFADQLRAQGVRVTTVRVPGTHGTALRQAVALDAIREFVAANE